MQINAVSFNIRNADDANGHSVEERAPRLWKIMKNYPADVIGLQEYTPKWADYIEKYFGEEYEIFNKYRSETTSDRESAPIMWRKDKFDCIKTGYFWLSDTPEIESRGWDELYDCFRICVYAILRDKKSGETFTFINTHFGFGDKGQTDSAKLIFEYSKKISDYPTFITGDFNMLPTAPGYLKMAELFTDVNAATAKDFGTTYHGYNPEVVTDKHIDYCFVNDKVKPLNQQIIKDTVDGKFPSDHFGLYITLEL